LCIKLEQKRSSGNCGGGGGVDGSGRRLQENDKS